MTGGKQVFGFNCMCCGKEQQAAKLQNIQSSEHLCIKCAKLDFESYAYVRSHRPASLKDVV